jgi:hypothetical protein
MYMQMEFHQWSECIFKGLEIREAPNYWRLFQNGNLSPFWSSTQLPFWHI